MKWTRFVAVVCVVLTVAAFVAVRTYEIHLMGSIGRATSERTDTATQSEAKP